MKVALEQKLELKEWREAKKKKEDCKSGMITKADGKKASSKSSKKQMESVVAKEVAKQLKKSKDTAIEEDDIDAMLMLLQSKTVEDKPVKKACLTESITINTSALKAFFSVSRMLDLAWHYLQSSYQQGRK